MSSVSSSRRRVIAVIPSLAGGGAERVMVHILNHLNRDRYEVLLLLLENEMTYLKDLSPEIAYRVLGKKGCWDTPLMIKRISDALRSFNPDAVLSSLRYTNIVCVLARAMSFKHPKLLLWEHIYPEIHGWFYNALLRLTYPFADKVITVSERIRRSLESEYGLSQKRLVTVYNPIPYGQIRARSEEPCDESLLGAYDLRIVNAGRLNAQKRHDRLIRAFAEVRRSGFNAGLFILGEGEERPALEKLTRELGLDASVRFLGFQKNPFPYIKRCDLFALSSDYEGFPMVLLEAMTTGTCVISTNCPSGPAEVIRQGINGWLTALDEHSLAQGITGLLRDAALRKRMAEQGSRDAEGFDIPRILPQFEALLG